MPSDLSNSTADNPDLDWNQIRETIRTLFLAVAQIEIAMRDSDLSMQQLVSSFTTMVDCEREIVQQVDQLDENDSKNNSLGLIKQRALQVSNEMQTAIVAFQFYDRMSQRIMHVSESMEALSELVGDSQRLYDPRAWRQLQQEIRAHYTMGEEREMFDSVMSGANVRDAIRRYNETHKDETDLGIEFF
jgi:tetrahydromethanopterin S-methyltransferase subunit B